MKLENLLLKLNGYVHKHSREILGRVYNNHEFNIEFLAQGEYNINYIIKTKNTKIVLRLNTASQINLKNQIKYEYNALEFLSPSGVTPKPYYLDDRKAEIPYGLLTMEYLPGRALNYNTDLERAANILGNIHSLKLDTKHDFIVERELFSARVSESCRLLGNVWNADCVSGDIKQFFKKFIEWAKKHKHDERYFLEHGNLVLNNTEVNSSNFILGEKDYLIDWEKPVISDCTQDITQFLIPTTTLWKTDIVLTEPELNNFFQIYAGNLGCSVECIKTKVDLYKPYMFLRALSWCAHAFVEYTNSTKDIINNDTFEKIKEYLQIERLANWLNPYFRF